MVEGRGERPAARVVVTLDGKQTRETILTIAGLPIFSKAYYTAPPVRFVLARPAARLRRLQGRQPYRRAASSSIERVPTIGARTCR